MMDSAAVLDIIRGAVTTLLMITAPVMIVALAVGLLVSFFQALTSIQEMTLTFVPKVILVFAVLVLTANWMGDKLSVYTEGLYDRIATINQK
ncbi:MAG: flagellar biosynthesis protein FliQ [Proteobacteria bacterium]|nr:flagellar biosynthesis protein FliQ [Pseudomonadota bacterium]